MNDITESLSAPADSATLDRLRARLTAHAAADGLLDGRPAR